MSAGNALLPLLEGARNCVRFGNVRPGEEVVILAEHGTTDLVIEALRVAAEEGDARVTVVLKEPTALGEPLSPVVDAVLKSAEMVFDLGYPTVHSKSGFIASFDYGTKNLIVRPEPEVLASEAAKVPIEHFYALGKRCQALLREQRVVSVTDERGTDLTMEVVPGSVGAYIGERPYEPGPAVPGYIGTFPWGTTVWGDLNYTANGSIVFDAAYAFTEPEPIRWRVEDGWVVDISGGEAAATVAALIEGHPNANRLAECGFGLNPKVDLSPGKVDSIAARSASVLSWTRRAGTFFSGVGGNTLMGGTDASPVVPIYHWLRAPTLRIGDVLVVDRGEFLLA